MVAVEGWDAPFERDGPSLIRGLLQNGHWVYILQGNLFHDFLEEFAQPMLYQPVTVWEGKIVKQIFPSQSRPNVHFAEVH